MCMEIRGAVGILVHPKCDLSLYEVRALFRIFILSTPSMATHVFIVLALCTEVLLCWNSS